MKLVILIVLLILTPITFSQNVPHLFELRGLEDSLDNTHLFYRYGYLNPQSISCWSKSIYHFDLANSSDTLFLWDSGGQDPIYGGCEGQWIGDFEFYNNDPAMYIYGGGDLWIDPIPFLVRYDGEIQIPVPAFGGITAIEISQQNEYLVYAAIGSLLIKSTDGGYNFVHLDSIQQVDNSIISLSRNNDLYIYGTDENKLVRTEDEGQNYIIVDEDMHWNWQYDRNLYYDSDGQHIYGVCNSYSESALLISGSNGDPFTWSNRITYNGYISFTMDENQPGEIYYSAGKQIFKSTDFGATFNLYKEFELKITGLYKKPSTDILYASTIFRIYEITPDTVQVIKSLPIPDEVLNYYPLSVGNKWVYDKTTVTYDPYPQYSHQVLVKEVLGDTIAANSKHYYYLKDQTGWGEYVLERIDSSGGKVYRYLEDPGLPENEYLLDDLLAEVGDTVNSYRMGYHPGSHTTVLDEITFAKWGLSKPKKVFEQYILHPPVYSLTQDIGLDSIYSYFDFGNTWIVLKGCIIDGVVYGDTTVVSVRDETQNQPTEFSLSQNYPNPFNPTTTIRFTISDLRFTILKVYDVLGNEVAILVNEEKPIGSYDVEFYGSNLPSGIYFYQLKAGSFIQTKKMVHLK
jgi:hypothetical protein